MPSVAEIFLAAKSARRNRVREQNRLTLAGEVGVAAHEDLVGFSVAPIDWVGRGVKGYSVFLDLGNALFSRPVNDELFIHDHGRLRAEWFELHDRLLLDEGKERLDDASSVDVILYTLLMSVACLADLSRPPPASPGTYMELLVGPVIGVLSGRPNTGAVVLEPSPGVFESVTVDMKFPHEGEPTLVVPTKLTTRERIVQPYVHQRILESASPGEYRSILVSSSENNVLLKGGEGRTLANSQVQDTLVPGTIAMYQKYVAELSGLYYLDPPAPYIEGAYDGLPRIGRVSDLLGKDLPGLLH